MDVAILGAPGDVGREIAARIVASRLLSPTERLQLVGREGGSSAQVLHGLASDITDAHAEYVPDLDVALRPEDIVADIWVVACGQTPPTAQQTSERNGTVDRASLGKTNAPIFNTYARALARYGQGTEIVVVVSNPVELAVDIFARAVDPKRVIGIGAYQDTLRFRREIASDLGVRRQRVGGFMVGEHGAAMVPVWSSVTLHGSAQNELPSLIRNLRRGTESIPFSDLVSGAREEMAALIGAGEIAEAYARLEQMPPDARALLKTYITHLSGAKTVRATAGVTVNLLETLLDGREMLVAGQVLLQGEFYGLHGPLGVPVLVGPGGVQRVVEIPLTDSERAHVEVAAADVRARVQTWRGALDTPRDTQESSPMMPLPLSLPVSKGSKL